MHFEVPEGWKVEGGWEGTVETAQNSRPSNFQISVVALSVFDSKQIEIQGHRYGTASEHRAPQFTKADSGLHSFSEWSLNL